jgi:hypothetical protein
VSGPPVRSGCAVGRDEQRVAVPPSRWLEMSEPKAIDPKLSTTDRVVKGKRSAASARGAPSAAGDCPPLPRPGRPSPASAGDLLGSPARGDPFLRRALPPHRPPGPNRGIYFYLCIYLFVFVDGGQQLANG